NNIIGADGILFVEASKNADALMRIFNSDGSEAEMCGNGLRIVGRYVCEQNNKDTVSIENVTGIIYPILMDKNFFEQVTAVTIQFPPPDFNTALVLANVQTDYIYR